MFGHKFTLSLLNKYKRLLHHDRPRRNIDNVALIFCVSVFLRNNNPRWRLLRCLHFITHYCANSFLVAERSEAVEFAKSDIRQIYFQFQKGCFCHDL